LQIKSAVNRSRLNQRAAKVQAVISATRDKTHTIAIMRIEAVPIAPRQVGSASRSALIRLLLAKTNKTGIETIARMVAALRIKVSAVLGRNPCTANSVAVAVKNANTTIPVV
jgi:hypothetical protein